MYVNAISPFDWRGINEKYSGYLRLARAIVINTQQLLSMGDGVVIIIEEKQKKREEDIVRHENHIYLIYPPKGAIFLFSVIKRFDELLLIISGAYKNLKKKKRM
jgi:hypothetical protein